MSGVRLVGNDELLRIVGAFGSCGSGKSYAIQRMVARELRRPHGWSFVDLDLNGEIPSRAPALVGSPPLRVFVAHTPDEARVALNRGARFVVVQPGQDVDDSDIPAIADELARHVWEVGGTILVLPEAHVACPEGRGVPPHVARILHRFRHNRGARGNGCGLWYDSQHFSRLSKRVEDETRLFLFHATSTPRDVERIRDLGGPELVRLVDECARRLAAGEKGWHVPVSSMNPRPPFGLNR